MGILQSCPSALKGRKGNAPFRPQVIFVHSTAAWARADIEAREDAGPARFDGEVHGSLRACRVVGTVRIQSNATCQQNVSVQPAAA